MKGRKYDDRETKLVYLKEDLYYNKYKKISESFININTNHQQ